MIILEDCLWENRKVETENKKVTRQKSEKSQSLADKESNFAAKDVDQLPLILSAKSVKPTLKSLKEAAEA